VRSTIPLIDDYMNRITREATSVRRYNYAVIYLTLFGKLFFLTLLARDWKIRESIDKVRSCSKLCEY